MNSINADTTNAIVRALNEGSTDYDLRAAVDIDDHADRQVTVRIRPEHTSEIVTYLIETALKSTGLKYFRMVNSEYLFR